MPDSNSRSAPRRAPREPTTAETARPGDHRAAAANAFGDAFLDRFRDIDNSELLADDALAAGPWEVRESPGGWGCFVTGADGPELEFPYAFQAELAILVLPHLPHAERYETTQTELLSGRRRRDAGATTLPDRLLFGMGLLLEMITHPESHAVLLELAGPTACQRTGYFLAERVETKRRTDRGVETGTDNGAVR